MQIQHCTYTQDNIASNFSGDNDLAEMVANVGKSFS